MTPTTSAGVAIVAPTVIRDLSRFEIGARLKERGLTQADIALRVHCSTGYVNRVIAGRTGRTRLTERIWTILERALGQNGGA